jgi:phage host-nuclease inhibitor protein Gam
MAKRKQAAPQAQLGDLGAVDMALAQIAAADADARRLATELEEEVGRLKANYGGRIGSLATLAREHRVLVEEFADAHPDLFVAPKHLALAHGRIGYREVTKIVLRLKPDAVVAALEARKYFAAVITKKSPDKDVLARYPDDVLAEVGAKRVTGDVFYIDCAAEAGLAAAK